MLQKVYQKGKTVLEVAEDMQVALKGNGKFGKH